MTISPKPKIKKKPIHAGCFCFFEKVARNRSLLFSKRARGTRSKQKYAYALHEVFFSDR